MYQNSSHISFSDIIASKSATDWQSLILLIRLLGMSNLVASSTKPFSLECCRLWGYQCARMMVVVFGRDIIKSNGLVNNSVVLVGGLQTRIKWIRKHVSHHSWLCYSGATINRFKLQMATRFLLMCSSNE